MTRRRPIDDYARLNATLDFARAVAIAGFVTGAAGLGLKVWKDLRPATDPTSILQADMARHPMIGICKLSKFQHS